MELPGIKAKSVPVNLPFGLGKLEFEANEVEERAAWSLHVELTTRTAIQSLDTHEGLFRGVLNSLCSLSSALYIIPEIIEQSCLTYIGT